MCKECNEKFEKSRRRNVSREMISNRQNPNEIIDLKPAAATKSFIDKREKQKEIVSKW